MLVEPNPDTKTIDVVGVRASRRGAFVTLWHFAVPEEQPPYGARLIRLVAPSWYQVLPDAAGGKLANGRQWLTAAEAVAHARAGRLGLAVAEETSVGARDLSSRGNPTTR